MSEKFRRQHLIKDSFISKMYRSMRSVLDYKPPVYPHPFVLGEWETKKEFEEVVSPEKNAETAAEQRIKSFLKTAKGTLEYAKKLAGFLENAITRLKKNSFNTAETEELKEITQEISDQISKLTKRQAELTPPLSSFDAGLKALDRKVSASLLENEKILSLIYHLPLNKDLIFHHFEIDAPKKVKAMIVFWDGMVDKKTINLSILQPLMLSVTQNHTVENEPQTIFDIINRRLPAHIAKTASGFDKIGQAINAGNTTLFIDGELQAVLIDTQGYEHRQVETAQSERSVQGTLSAFTEILRTNISMVRAIMPTSELINETLTVGDRIPVPCSIMYLKSIANPDLVNEVKRRLSGVRTDYVTDIGVLEQFIDDQPSIFFPKTLQTERPDRVAANLAEGMVAIFLHGSSFAMVVPVTYFTFFHFIEDYSLHPVTANIMRLTRVIGAVLTALVPGIYIALTYFHQEAIPTDLALALAASREKVPFPAIVEIIIMEIAFELVRESGLRMPGVLGPTIGIVGGIIIGQAAVTAHLVSPIVVVIVAITGLASFTIPDYRMSGVFRDIRYIFLILAFTFGLVGIGAGLLLFTLIACYTKSFGVPYMSPLASKTNYGFDTLLRGPVFRQEYRPDFAQAKETRRQPHISREWSLEPLMSLKKNNDKNNGDGTS